MKAFYISSKFKLFKYLVSKKYPTSFHFFIWASATKSREKSGSFRYVLSEVFVSNGQNSSGGGGGRSGILP